MKKKSISVVIMAFNREDKIGKALDSVKDFADEIIIVDNESTDKTAAIARKYTKKVFTQKNNPLDIDRQKNFGFSKATMEWTLNLDADEQVTPELAEEIKSVIADESPTIGYWIPRKNIIFGKWIQHAGWYPDHQLRLFKTGKGTYTSGHVHEMIHLEGKTEYLHTDLLHENYESIDQFISRNLLQYAKNEAQAKIAERYVFSFSDALLFPANEFFSRYFAREGYKDGFHGLMLSLFMAVYHLVVFAYVWEEEKFPQKELSIQELERTTEKIEKESRYWFATTAINNEKNPLQKILLKVKRKAA